MNHIVWLPFTFSHSVPRQSHRRFSSTRVRNRCVFAGTRAVGLILAGSQIHYVLAESAGLAETSAWSSDCSGKLPFECYQPSLVFAGWSTGPASGRYGRGAIEARASEFIGIAVQPDSLRKQTGRTERGPQEIRTLFISLVEL